MAYMALADYDSTTKETNAVVASFHIEEYWGAGLIPHTISALTERAVATACRLAHITNESDVTSKIRNCLQGIARMFPV